MLDASNTLCTGPKHLDQYEVMKTFTETFHGEKGIGAQSAKFLMVLRRKYSYQLVSVYIPSLTLIVIVLLTMHIDIEHFEANIMVHLTSMLVMYTLFQAIATTLPQVLGGALTTITGVRDFYSCSCYELLKQAPKWIGRRAQFILTNWRKTKTIKTKMPFKGVTSDYFVSPLLVTDFQLQN